jgi:hypothetical protein
MDYEKRYNEALERARALWREAIEKEYVEDYLKDYETIFPELRESEDERIRKAIVHLLEVASDAYLIEATGFKKEQFLSYLEKQKESLHISETCKENAEYFTSQCGDNRFELIDKAKRDIIAKTNIESSPDEMKVLNSFLFRAWQMGWLGKYDVIVPEQRPSWSEEDIEKMVNARARKSGTTKTEMCFYRQGIEDTLKSLRPSWKPSEKQEEPEYYQHFDPDC